MRPHNGLICFIVAWLVTNSIALAACVGDTDGDGVCDNVDVCPNTVPGAPVESDGCPVGILGDYDRDGDVDPNDLAVMSECESGPGIPASVACQTGDFDSDFDADVDQADFAAFQRCFSGENQAADPDCASHLVSIEDGCLHIMGTPAGTSLALRLVPGLPTLLEIDVGNDGWPEFHLDRSQFDCIVVNAGSGDDVVWIDEANGVFTDTEITTINGGNGNDTLLGGSGGETFSGGPGDDSVYMGAGNDRFVWNPGHETDFIEGSDGIDTIEVNGDDGAETFTIFANGTRVRLDRVSPAPFFLDIGTGENLVLKANGGNDALSCTGNLAALIQITLDGGAGDDTLLGSNGVDVLMGGDDNDFIDGRQGNDVAFLGAGNDVFQWDPGDGSDTIEGQADTDRLLFNGSAANEIFDLSANGTRLRFTRNIGSVVLDLDGVERVDVNALGGTDTINVNSLASTAVTQVSVDLTGVLGGGSGDGLADTVTVNGTAAPDTIDVSANADVVVVAGLAAQVQIGHSEAANDSLIVNGLDGVDTITQGPGVAALIMLTVNQ